MGDAFLYPFLHGEVPPMLIELAEQVVRCINRADLETARLALAAFEERAERLSGKEKTRARLILEELYVADDQLDKADRLSAQIDDAFDKERDWFAAACKASIDGYVAYLRGDGTTYKRQLAVIGQYIAKLRNEAEKRNIIRATRKLMNVRALVTESRYGEALKDTRSAKQIIKTIKKHEPITSRLFRLALCFEGRLYYHLNDYPSSESVFLRLMEGEWYPDEVRLYLGRVKCSQREFARAAEIFGQCLESFIAKDKLRRVGECKNELARAELGLGRLDRAEALFEETVDALRGPKEFNFERGRALLGFAQCLFYRGQYDRAAEQLASATAILEPLNKRYYISCRLLEGLVLLETSRYDEAASALAAARESCPVDEERYRGGEVITTAYNIEAARVRRYQAILDARQGRYDLALEYSRQSAAVLDRIHSAESDELYVKVLLEGAIYVLVRSRDRVEISDNLKRARTIATYRLDITALVRIHLVEAMFLSLNGLRAKASDAMRRAMVKARKLGDSQGRASDETILDLVRGCVRLVGNTAESDNLIRQLYLSVDEMPAAGDEIGLEEVQALKRGLQTIAGGLADSNGALVDAMRQQQHQVLSDYDELFPRGGTLGEWLRHLDYSSITAAMGRCTLLPEIAEEYGAELSSALLEYPFR